MHDHQTGSPGVEWGQERQLVVRLDKQVGTLRPQVPTARLTDLRVVAVAVAIAPHRDARDTGLGGRARKAGAEHGHPIARRREPPEDLEQMDLRPARGRVVEVALVEDQDVAAHARSRL